MWLFICLTWSLTAILTAAAQSTQGIQDLVKRRLPNHVNEFEFLLTCNETTPISTAIREVNDNYTISSTAGGKILVEGNSLIALASGLHRYLTDVVNVDIFWYIGSRLDVGPSSLPTVETPINGASVVPWRYHFNTVTFSYTAAFWTWEDWELELDWLALRGVNLPLAWVGQEKILVDAFREIGLTDAEISTWGGDLPMQWIENQFELQKNITQRMVELGMTPVLPCFTGFVPRAITRVLPNAAVVNGSQWNGFPTEYTNVTFLEPSDPNFEKLQISYITKQANAYGNITHFYTLDQYNENNPYLNSTDYLTSVSNNTMKSLKTADPEAIWLMQGWLFYSSSTFWIKENVEAYLGGVSDNSDMLVLDLFAESQPQWSNSRVNSYYGKPWIWCQLHDYGGSMGLYGQIMNITINPIEALASSSSLVGFGLTMEGQEGNEVMYDLLLDQAWSKSPIDTDAYFSNWVTRRYAGSGELPNELYQAWDMMRTTVYNNTNLAASTAVTKSILELSPSITGMLGSTGHHAITLTYDPDILTSAWKLMFAAATPNPSLWDNPAYQYDMVDITRQVLSNNFAAQYTTLVNTYNSTTNSTSYNATTISTLSKPLLDTLTTLDQVLSTNPSFTLSTWLSAALASSPSTSPSNQSFFTYNARNQITLWGPDGEISDYASKSWGGLVSGYYVPRWEIFTQYLQEADVQAYDGTVLGGRLKVFEVAWQSDGTGNGNTTLERVGVDDEKVVSLETVLGEVVKQLG